MNTNFHSSILEKAFEEELQCSIANLSLIGKGASGVVYKAELDAAPYTAVIKISKFPDLLQEEYANINFISDRADCKLPKLYFFFTHKGIAYLAMEHIEGVEPTPRNLLFRKNKNKLACEIVENLIRIHSVTNDKYGPVNNAVYETWFEYYFAFAKEIADFTDGSDVPKTVKKAVFVSLNKLDKILSGSNGAPTLIHGDYWCPNFIVDRNKMELKGIIDPFNIMWAEPEYELFTLTTGYGRKLKLYKTYKKYVKTTEFCDMKTELYALYNELLWYKKLGSINFFYLKYRSKRLLSQMKKNKLI